ncbi:MAG TPA: IPT/TIG domain-containing protein [Pseudomonadota bacterium]|nr:IPT/TIG domain-containing protein [Pseudomonadota bacterium]
MRNSQLFTQARRFWLLLLFGVLSGCGPGGQILQVMFSSASFPNPIHSLQVLPLLNGQIADQRLSIPVPMGDAVQHSFVLVLPASAVGELRLLLAKFDADGCLQSAEPSRGIWLDGTGHTQQVQVGSFTDGFSLTGFPGMPYWHPGGCLRAETIPVLAFVEVSIFTPFQPGGTLTIDGWGFLPGCTFTINGVAAEVVRWHSPLRVEVRVPAAVSAIPPISINVQNPDGESDTRTDLIRSM